MFGQFIAHDFGERAYYQIGWSFQPEQMVHLIDFKFILEQMPAVPIFKPVHRTTHTYYPTIKWHSALFPLKFQQMIHIYPDTTLDV